MDEKVVVKTVSISQEQPAFTLVKQHGDVRLKGSTGVTTKLCFCKDFFMVFEA